MHTCACVVPNSAYECLCVCQCACYACTHTTAEGGDLACCYVADQWVSTFFFFCWSHVDAYKRDSGAETEAEKLESHDH